MKGVVIYKSKYGATEQYANWLGHILGMRVYEADEMTPARLSEFDLVICGTPVYVGKLVMAKWLRANEQRLSGKKVYMFIVCATPPTNVSDFNKIVEPNVSKKLRDSVHFYFIRGRVVKKSLTFFDSIVLRMGASMQKNKSDRERMLTDFDDVKKEHLKEIVNAIRSAANINAGNQVLG